MTAKEWLQNFAALLGVEPPNGAEIRDLLEIAGEAAHGSERIAAPVACWLIARAGVAPAEALARIKQWKIDGVLPDTTPS